MASHLRFIMASYFSPHFVSGDRHRSFHHSVCFEFRPSVSLPWKHDHVTVEIAHPSLWVQFGNSLVEQLRVF